MTRIFALASITFREGIRNRSVFGVILLSLFILGLNVVVAGFFMRDVGKVTVDMNLSALSFSGLLLVFFVALNLISKDIDRKTIQLVLSKPFSRGEYIWGKYFGIIGFVFASLLFLFLLSCGTVSLLRNFYPGYFGQFSWVGFMVASFFIYFKLVVLSAIVVFFSAITTSSFITLIFSVCSYLVGETVEEVVFYIRSGFGKEQISVALQNFIEIISYVFPNLAVFNFQLEAAHGMDIEISRIVFALGYGGLYVVVLLALAALIFARREFN